MAKKPVSSVVSKKPAATVPAAVPKAAPAKAVASTAVRNSPVPKAVAPKPAAAVPAKREIGHADIAKRAYEIWASGQGGSETENWLRAERELRGI
jgi:hypothetical protein